MRRRGTNLDGSSSGPGWLMPALAVVLALAAAWVLALTLLGGGETTGQPEQGSATTVEPTPAAASTTPEKVITTDTGPGSPGVSTNDPVAKEGDSGPGSASSEQESGGDSPTPSAVEVDRKQAPPPVPKKPEGQVIPKGQPKYNPLGKDIHPNQLTETQRGRVELAASQFVVHAYGFSGKGKSAGVKYEQGISRSVVAPVFYESPGAVPLAKLEKQIESTGVQSTAYLDSFDVQEVSPKTIKGAVRFTTKNPSSQKSYTQELLMQSSGAIWRIREAGEIKGVG